MTQSQRLKKDAVMPVRVSRNGNACTLAIPAEILRLGDIRQGDRFVVSYVDGDLLYHRVADDRLRGRFVGEGNDRAFELARGTVVPGGPDPVTAPPIDWDF